MWFYFPYGRNCSGVDALLSVDDIDKLEAKIWKELLDDREESIICYHCEGTMSAAPYHPLFDPVWNALKELRDQAEQEEINCLSQKR